MADELDRILNDLSGELKGLSRVLQSTFKIFDKGNKTEAQFLKQVNDQRKIFLDILKKEGKITEETYKTEVKPKPIVKTKNLQLGIKQRKWKAYDYAYWLQFGIDSETLKKYHVVPIEYFFINISPFKADKHAYAFIERKDGKETYKIYQPYSKRFKWLNNHDASIWQGWDQLPDKGPKLIITKSLKDVMSIVSVTGIPAVSLQSETTMPKEHIIDELASRFERIWVLYDNDFDKDVNIGRKQGQKIADEFYLMQIEIPVLYSSKDFSDLVKNENQEIAKLTLEHIMQQYDNPPF